MQMKENYMQLIEYVLFILHYPSIRTAAEKQRQTLPTNTHEQNHQDRASAAAAAAGVHQKARHRQIPHALQLAARP